MGEILLPRILVKLQLDSYTNELMQRIRSHRCNIVLIVLPCQCTHPIHGSNREYGPSSGNHKENEITSYLVRCRGGIGLHGFCHTEVRDGDALFDGKDFCTACRSARDRECRQKLNS